MSFHDGDAAFPASPGLSFYSPFSGDGNESGSVGRGGGNEGEVGAFDWVLRVVRTLVPVLVATREPAALLFEGPLPWLGSTWLSSDYLMGV